MTDAAATAISFTRSACGALLDIVYPPRCVLCDEPGCAALCERCLADASRPLPEPTCSQCGRSCAALPCSDCLADPPAYLAAVAAGVHDGALREAVHWLKYRDRPFLAEPLGAILVECAERNTKLLGGLAFDAVIPVPMHPSRKRVRGYNQAERLAKVVGRLLRVPVDTSGLIRVKNTRSQVGQSAAMRQTNVESAFRANSDSLTGQTLLLIDDVTTTGTTLKRCADALKQAGARSVYALALAAG